MCGFWTGSSQSLEEQAGPRLPHMHAILLGLTLFKQIRGHKMWVLGGIFFSEMLSISVTLSAAVSAAPRAGLTMPHVFKSQMRQA